MKTFWENAVIFEYDKKALDRLEKIYELYARVMEERGCSERAACAEGCASCCTCNVTLTSLEAAFLADRLDQPGRERAAGNLAARFPEKRYTPLLTTNGFAQACMSGKEVPEEENDPSWGECPLLEDGLCTVYPYRPFGCRAMVSETLCSKAGYARMPPRVLTLNNIFLQSIEHMDIGGVTGNLSDLLPLFLDLKKLDKDDSDRKKKLPEKLKTQGKILRNSKIPVLMVPPEHREMAGPVIRQITALT